VISGGEVLTEAFFSEHLAVLKARKYLHFTTNPRSSITSWYYKSLYKCSEWLSFKICWGEGRDLCPTLFFQATFEMQQEAAFYLLMRGEKN